MLFEEMTISLNKDANVLRSSSVLFCPIWNWINGSYYL